MWFPILKSYRIIDLETDSEVTVEKLINDADTLTLKTGSTSYEATSGAVVVPITEEYSGYTSNDTAAIAATLADGVNGQTKIIKFELKDTNNMVVTPANLADGATLTFDATGEIVILRFVVDTWQVIYSTATVA